MLLLISFQGFVTMVAYVLIVVGLWTLFQRASRCVQHRFFAPRPDEKIRLPLYGLSAWGQLTSTERTRALELIERYPLIAQHYKDEYASLGLRRMLEAFTWPEDEAVL